MKVRIQPVPVPAIGTWCLWKVLRFLLARTPRVTIWALRAPEVLTDGRGLGLWRPQYFYIKEPKPSTA